ncbi:hypothetical protein J6590_096394 [Homalodisca vitripennis]|nr:hypothetical protein J6590_096394 [Homalodisca vitripennis]
MSDPDVRLKPKNSYCEIRHSGGVSHLLPNCYITRFCPDNATMRKMVNQAMDRAAVLIQRVWVSGHSRGCASGKARRSVNIAVGSAKPSLLQSLRRKLRQVLETSFLFKEEIEEVQSNKHAEVETAVQSDELVSKHSPPSPVDGGGRWTILILGCRISGEETHSQLRGNGREPPEVAGSFIFSLVLRHILLLFHG